MKSGVLVSSISRMPLLQVHQLKACSPVVLATEPSGAYFLMSDRTWSPRKLSFDGRYLTLLHPQKHRAATTRMTCRFRYANVQQTIDTIRDDTPKLAVKDRLLPLLNSPICAVPVDKVALITQEEQQADSENLDIKYYNLPHMTLDIEQVDYLAVISADTVKQRSKRSSKRGPSQMSVRHPRFNFRPRTRTRKHDSKREPLQQRIQKVIILREKSELIVLRFAKRREFQVWLFALMQAWLRFHPDAPRTEPEIVVLEPGVTHLDDASTVYESPKLEDQMATLDLKHGDTDDQEATTPSDTSTICPPMRKDSIRRPYSEPPPLVHEHIVSNPLPPTRSRLPKRNAIHSFKSLCEPFTRPPKTPVRISSAMPRRQSSAISCVSSDTLVGTESIRRLYTQILTELDDCET